MKTARTLLGDALVWGNLDPSYLRGSEILVRTKSRVVIDAAGSQGHILHIGHGVHKDTLIENVRAFVETAQTHAESPRFSTS